MSSNFQNNTGLFIPTTYVFDVAQVRDIDVNKPEFKELLVRLYQNINNMCVALNLKESGLYYLQEFVTGQVLFPNPAMINPNPEGRQIFRTVLNFGALPNATTIAVPHSITVTNATTWVNVYGVATNPVSLLGIGIPYTSTSAVIDNIEWAIDATNFYITTGIDYSAYTRTVITIEYVKE
jgi:hypothetical protein